MSSSIRKIQKRKMNEKLTNMLTDLISFKKKTDEFLSAFKPADDSTCKELKDLSEKIQKDYDVI